GPNVSYFERRGRLASCRHGLLARPASAVTWGLPADIAATPLGRAVAARLRDAPLAPPAARCEIDLVVRPGTEVFTRAAECRLALVAAGTATDPRLHRDADQVVEVTDDQSLERALDSAG
ncbi:MAG: hypothetical protein K8S94_00850, partial [Planctomycetia bacterium]|nr:hypothetical protein [Planctomycetia bacterium]